MKIKDNNETRKRHSIESMLYRIAETIPSISIAVLIHSSIAILNGYRTAVWKYRNNSARKQRNRSVNQ